MKKRKKKTKIFIAVDGGSASGKTTAAEFLSSYYNINFLSSGRLYRYCALKIINNKNNYNKLFINKIIKSLKDKSLKNNKLYNKEVTKKSSEIAKVKYIRESLKKFQLKFYKNLDGAIIEGRDIGTKIMPNADLKLFFVCSAKEKARRRFKEFKKVNKNISFKEVKKALIQRDYDDKHRKISPLIKAKNAVLVDTTKLTITDMRLKLIKIVDKVLICKYGNI